MRSKPAPFVIAPMNVKPKRRYPKRFRSGPCVDAWVRFIMESTASDIAAEILLAQEVLANSIRAEKRAAQS